MLRLGCLDTPVTPGDMGHVRRSDGANWFDPSVKLAEYLEARPVSRRAP